MSSPEVVDLCGPSLPSQVGSANECPICLESIALSGEHSMVSTLCGHLFGRSCLALALATRSECPKCRASSKSLKKRKRAMFIPLYDSNVTVLDNTALIELQQRLTASETSHQQVCLYSMECS